MSCGGGEEQRGGEVKSERAASSSYVQSFISSMLWFGMSE
jgi:hypothetical protein